MKLKEKKNEKDEHFGELNTSNVQRMSIKESYIPLEALYNDKMEILKQFDYYNHINPLPITMSFYNAYDGNSNHNMVRLINEELSITLDHQFSNDESKMVY